MVQSFEELKLRASEAIGRIVVFNQPFVSYGVTVAYRAYGASQAAKVGAVATLIRSVTPFSINRYLSMRKITAEGPTGLTFDPPGVMRVYSGD